jgi:NADH-quinone oxidoreductase subunit F
MVRALHVLTRFYAHESCGQCSPCREGVGWTARIVERILEGRGRVSDLDALVELAENYAFRTICAFGAGASGPVTSFVRKFRGEFEHHVRHGRCEMESAAGAAVGGGS